MATINFATREITAKVVYFGATGAGSNTNVRKLYEILPTREKSKLHKFGPGETEERSWYFDYVAAGEPKISGFRTRYRVYSLPGGLSLAAHREEVIAATDAVVFVADARPDRNQANVDSLLELEQLLSSIGLELTGVPVVLQVNHRDAPEARPPEDVVFDLNPYGFPVLPAIAVEGKGVVETHVEVTAALDARVRDHLAGNEGGVTLTAVHRPGLESDNDVIRAHVEAIQAKSAATPHTAIDELSVQPEDLPATAIEIPFQPREFIGMKPSRVAHVDIDGDQIHIGIVMERMSGGDPRRLDVRLANRPTDTPPMPRHSPSSPGGPPTTSTHSTPGRVFDFLPADGPSPVPQRDLPPVVYGILGVTGGVVIGLSLGYLVGLVG